MASKKVNIQIDTRANTTGAKQAETAMDGLAAANQRADTAAIATGKSTGRVGQIATSAGYQVQDFAVQVAGGTSALTAMAQQAPQFLGVFGPGGAIAGALIAVGAIAAKVFMGMADDSASAAEKAALLADAVEQIGENAGKAVAKDIDFGLAQINAAEERAKALIGAFDGVKDAANAAALATLTNAEKIREAEVEIARLRGEQVDEIANIAANTEAEAAARAEQARQEIAAQNERNAKAKEQEEIARQAFLQAQSLATQTEIQRQAETRKLEVLRAQRDALAEQAKERVTIAESLAQGGIPFLTTPAADRAQAQLEDPAFQALIAATEAKVNALDEQLKEQGGKLAEEVANASSALESAMTNTAAIAQEVAIAIPEIEKAFQAEDIKAQVQGLTEIGQQAAKEITALVETAKPENSGQQAALESLKQATADGQITANETAKVAAALQTLNGSFAANMQASNANVQGLIQAVTTLSQRVTEQKRQIDSLNARIRSGN